MHFSDRSAHRGPQRNVGSPQHHAHQGGDGDEEQPHDSRHPLRAFHGGESPAIDGDHEVVDRNHDRAFRVVVIVVVQHPDHPLARGRAPAEFCRGHLHGAELDPGERIGNRFRARELREFVIRESGSAHQIEKRGRLFALERAPWR